MAAVQTSREGWPQRVKFSVVKWFRSPEMTRWAKRHLGGYSHVVSDGLKCFEAVAQSGCTHEAVITGGGCATVEKPGFYWVNTILGNLKTALRSSCHSFKPKYAQCCLAEFEYRFNRRSSLPDLIPRLAHAALRMPSLPERLLKHGLC
ncbi:MAG: transposase [Gammaproteobacteria bacterium]|nr:transposase [Gammaproteobacteria bacterium]